MLSVALSRGDILLFALIPAVASEHAYLLCFVYIYEHQFVAAVFYCQVTIWFQPSLYFSIVCILHVTHCTPLRIYHMVPYHINVQLSRTDLQQCQSFLAFEVPFFIPSVPHHGLPHHGRCHRVNT